MASKKNVGKTKTLSEKKKKLTVRNKNLKKLEKRLKNVDKELAVIEKELLASGSQRSRLLDEDLRGVETKLLHLDVPVREPAEKEKNAPDFYRHFVFKCMKCKGEFEKRINMPPIKKSITCPACGKDHALGFYPSSRFYHVSHSKDIEIKNPKG
jgi:rRNA maturation endonuclease Nob1